MLSQVKNRLLYPIFFENISKSALVARFSSKKGPKEPFVSPQEEKNSENGLPEDIFDKEFFQKKPQTPKTKTSDEFSDVFDAVLNASFKTKEKNKNQKNRFSNAKPGQLNIQMAKAANSVAEMAGDKREEVLGDIMDKLHTVFPGMEHHVKGKRKYGRNKKDATVEATNNLNDQKQVEDIVGMAVGQKERKRFQDDFSKRDRKAASTSESGDVISELLAEKVFSPSSRGDGQQRFVGQSFTSIDKLLKSQKPLGIFTSKLASSSSLIMWEKFEKVQVERSTKHEPLNWFDQCIQWTEEGKLWHFPIDNEQGMDKEAEVDFSEHIFLDHHADSWCPREGPIKYFMELVLVGLSKNPFLTVQEKKETIDWYRDYFTQHQSLLEEINAFGSPQNPIDVEGKMS